MSEKLTVLGRVIGAYQDWDSMSDSHLVFYDFKPSDGIGMPEGDLGVQYEDGHFEMYNPGNGEVTWSADIVSVLKDLPRENEN